MPGLITRVVVGKASRLYREGQIGPGKRLSGRFSCLDSVMRSRGTGRLSITTGVFDLSLSDVFQTPVERTTSWADRHGQTTSMQRPTRHPYSRAFCKILRLSAGRLGRNAGADLR